jgi:hypothetical protein
MELSYPRANIDVQPRGVHDHLTSLCVQIKPTITLEELQEKHADVLAWIVANESKFRYAEMLHQRLLQFKVLTARQLAVAQQHIAEEAAEHAGRRAKSPAQEDRPPVDAARLDILFAQLQQAYAPWTPFELASSTPLERIYVNARYHVTMREVTSSFCSGQLTYLIVWRRATAPPHDWHDLHRIKDELAGPNRVAVEVYEAKTYPSEANEYHLFILPEGVRAPFEEQKSLLD